MILDRSYGKDKEIRRLISKSFLNMDPISINAWMKYKYDPEGMFCFVQDKQVVACLQTVKRTLYFNGKKCEALILTLACTLPDHRQRGYFSQLLEACMSYAACNDLISLSLTNFPQLLEAKSFQAITKSKYYWIEAEEWNKGNSNKVKIYRPDIDLYPLYQEFLSHFDGSIHLNEKEFKDTLHYYQNCNHRIAVMFDEDDDPHGFAIYKVQKEHIDISTLIYLDADALFDLFAYIFERSESLSFVVSSYERFDKILPMDIPRNHSTVLARLNNYKLFSQWSHGNYRHAKEAFQTLKKPIWNLLID